MAQTEIAPGISRIDPFSKKFKKIAAKHPRDHYLDHYREIFDDFPGLFEKLGDDAMRSYYGELAGVMLAPFARPDPFELWKSACGLASYGLKAARGAMNYQNDERVKTGLRHASEKWELGKNIAITPRETVYQSEVLKVYHYRQDGPVRRRPFLMFYSWINAYWILDLTPETSMVKYLRDQGLDVYMTDWTQPVTDDAFNLDFAAYIEECLRAVEAVLAHSGQDQLCIGGYCIGGVLADVAAALESDHLVCLVNLTAGLDTMAGEEGAGPFGAFTNFEIAHLPDYAAKHGNTLPRKEFAEFFDNVKPKKAVEGFIQRYLYAAEVPDDPVSFWNRQSAKPVYPVHLEFLKRIYNDNEIEHGTMAINGRMADLKKITVPAQIICAQFDHIVPLPVALRTCHLLGTPPEDQEVILIKGGHVRAIVNPPLYGLIAEFLKKHAGKQDRHLTT